MSGSAISSAKRRRANNVLTSPLFQNPENQQNQSNSQDKSSIEDMPNRPLTLQQALQILNGRIVQLERTASNGPTENTSTENTPTSSVDETRVQEIVSNMMETHLSEFNHRYEVLASEILNLKHIVMKLQSYTLDINKTLIEERIQVLSEMPDKGGISIIEVTDDLHLREDITNMTNDSMLNDLKLTADEEDIETNKEETHLESVTENISLEVESANSEVNELAIEASVEETSAPPEVNELAIEASVEETSAPPVVNELAEQDKILDTENTVQDDKPKTNKKGRANKNRKTVELDLENE